MLFDLRGADRKAFAEALEFPQIAFRVLVKKHEIQCPAKVQQQDVPEWSRVVFAMIDQGPELDRQVDVQGEKLLEAEELLLGHIREFHDTRQSCRKAGETPYLERRIFVIGV